MEKCHSSFGPIPIPRNSGFKLNLLQCYAVQFQGGKTGQEERGRECASFQLIRNAGLRFLLILDATMLTDVTWYAAEAKRSPFQRLPPA